MKEKKTSLGTMIYGREHIHSRAKVIARQLTYKFLGFCDEAKRVAVYSFFFNVFLAYPKNPHLTKKKTIKKPSNRWYWYRLKADFKKKLKKGHYYTLRYVNETLRSMMID
jgi:hypothetical protein